MRGACSWESTRCHRASVRRLRPDELAVPIPSGYDWLAESLRVDLRRLLEESPGALVVGPSPDSERREPPVRIQLAAWATDIAATLNDKYGNLLDLHVGAMTFPARQLWVSEHTPQLRGAPAEPAGLEVEALSPLSVRTGRSTHEDVLVANRTAHEQVLSPTVP